MHDLQAFIMICKYQWFCLDELKAMDRMSGVSK